MITTTNIKTTHIIKTDWNKYKKGKQYTFALCDVYCIYFLGILIFKRIQQCQ